MTATVSHGPDAYEHVAGPPQPCVVCRRPTGMRHIPTREYRHLPLGPCRPTLLAGVTMAPARQAPTRPLFARSDQQRAYAQRVAVLTAMDPADDSDEAITEAARGLRIIEAMTDDPGDDNRKSGPFAPTKYGKLAPFWTAKLPDIAPPLVAFAGWATFRATTDYTGPTIALDRNASHPSALSSLRVAHGQLEPTGPLPDASRPGYYKTLVHPWTRPDLPNPMGNRPVGSESWITHERMRLLDELADRGPDWWPDATILDSRTSEREVPLRDLSQLIKQLRIHVIDTWGKDSVQWEAIKEASNNKLIQILMGSPREPGAPWIDRKWYTKCHRTDWGHALHDKAAANLYRAALKLIDGGVTVLSIRNMDAMDIPAAHLARAGELLKLDQSGRALGTFKTEPGEAWGA